MEYKFKWKRKLIWRIKSVVGHSYTLDADKMVLFMKDGALYEIPRWRDCYAALGIDWKMAVHKKMESEAGSKISLELEK